MAENSKKIKERGWNKMGDTFYGLGLVGALFYFIQNAHTFGAGVIGVLKAIIWPALVVFKLLDFLKI